MKNVVIVKDSFARCTELAVNILATPYVILQGRTFQRHAFSAGHIHRVFRDLTR